MPLPGHRVFRTSQASRDYKRAQAGMRRFRYSGWGNHCAPRVILKKKKKPCGLPCTCVSRFCRPPSRSCDYHVASVTLPFGPRAAEGKVPRITGKINTRQDADKEAIVLLMVVFLGLPLSCCHPKCIEEKD